MMPATMVPPKSPGGAASITSLPLTRGRNTPNVRMPVHNPVGSVCTPNARIVLPQILAVSARVTPIPVTVVAVFAAPPLAPMLRRWLFSIETDAARASSAEMMPLPQSSMIFNFTMSSRVGDAITMPARGNPLTWLAST
jgi:hypothetical protein